MTQSRGLKPRSMELTVQGHETEQQLAVLCTLGCTEMQGYLFCKPKPAVEITPLLMPRRARAASVA